MGIKRVNIKECLKNSSPFQNYSYWGYCTVETQHAASLRPYFFKIKKNEHVFFRKFLNILKKKIPYDLKK